MRKLLQKPKLLLMALSALAACTTWAATLSYSGYISTDSANPTTVFSGVNLSDIGSTYVLKGNMGGGYVTSPGEAGVYRASLDNGVLTVQFQKIDGMSSTGIYAKGVVVKFQQSGDDITAYASATGYSSTLTLGQDYSSSTGTPASSASANGYGIYDVSLVAGRKVEYKNTGTTSGTYTIAGGYAAQPTWKLNIPAKGAATSGALVKVKAIKIGSRTTSWDADYDSASVTINGASSTPISTYATPYLLAYNSATTCKPLEYVFPDATPLMVNVGTDYDASFYKADGTQTSKNPGGSYLIKTADAVEYALRMPNVHSAGWRPVQEVETLVVATATTSADANWSALTWTNGAADWTAAGATPVVLTVSDDCTVTLDSNVSLESIVFDIADGKTLTLSGANTITAANGIIIRGGTVSVSAANLVGTVYGDGELKFVGIRPTTTATNPSLVLTDSAWEGTVTIQYNYENKATLTARQLFPQAWGSANSKIKWNGVAGYFGGCTSAAGWILEDLTVNDTKYPALRKNDGGSSSMTTAPSLSGSGTFADESNPTERFKFADGSSFAGSINITSSSGYGMNVQFGATAVDKVARTIHVLSGATVNVAANKTWAAPGGMVVAGTLTVGSGAIVPTITTTNTAQYQFAANATIGTVSGDALASALYITSGTLAVSDTSKTTLTIPAQLNTTYYNAGTLDLRGCTSLTALMLDLGNTVGTGLSLSNITLPAGCTVYAEIGSVRDMSAYTSLISGATYLVEETKEEYGVGSVTVENVPTGASVSVLRPDGTIVAAMVDGTTATLSETVKIDGAATGFDATFTNTLAMAYSEISAAYINTSATTHDYEDGDGFYIRQAPWLSGGGQYFYDHSAEIGIVVVGKMTPSYNKIFIHIGNSNSGGHGILIATGESENEVVIAYNDANTVTPITTMTVPNAATARHVYVINKVDSGDQSIVTIYLDGIKWKTVSLAKFDFTAESGVQVGSDFGGAIWRSSGGTYSGGNVTAADDTGVLNVMRVFGHALGTAQVNAFTEEYPYVSPNGSSVRTFAAASEDWVENGAADWANTYEETTTQAEAPRAGSALTVNTSVATTISANLESTVSYDSLTVNGTGATFAKVNGYGGVISVAGSSVIGAPVTINAGALVLGGPVTITEGGSVTFDYSGYEVASADVIQLTGEMEEAESGKITIVPPADQHYTYTYGYSGTQYVITPAVAVAVLNHNGTLTGYTTIDAALAAAQDGDTVTLQTAYLTPGTHATYAGDKTGVNVVVQGYTIAPAVADGTTTWSTSSYIWTGAGTAESWTDPANWGLPSGYPNAADASVSFYSDATINLSGTFAQFSGLYTAATVTFKGNGTTSNGIRTASAHNSGNLLFTGTGKIRLAGVCLDGSYGTNTEKGTNEINVDLEIVDDTVNYIRLATGNTRYVAFYVRGEMSGGGTLIATCGSESTNYQLYLTGDAAQFHGVFADHAEGDAYPVHVNISSADAISANATYNLVTYSDAGRNYFLRGGGGSSTIYNIGALNGTVYFDGNNNSGSNQYFGYILSIGGKNENCSFGGSLARSGYASTTKKVGTADMVYTGSNIPNITIEDGTYIIGAASALPSSEIVFAGGALSVAEGLEVDPSSKFSSSSTAAIVFDDRGYDNEWATALTSTTAPYGLRKKGAGTLTLTQVPAYTGATTLEAGTLVVPEGATLANATITGGTLQIGQGGTITKLAMTGGKIEVPISGAVSDATILTITELAEGTTLTTDNFTFPASVTLTLDTQTSPGAVLVKATREVKNYVWTGATSTAFDTLGNWLVNGAVPTEAPYASIDTIEFPADGAPWTVALSDDVEIKSVAVNGAVTLTGGKLLANAFTGSAAITLGGNAGIGDYEPSANMTIANPIVVSGTGNSLNANTVYVTYSGAISSADDTAELTLYGAVERVNLTGNNSGLQGQVYMNGHVTLASSTAGSANAKWVIANTTGDYDNPIRANSVQFGELSGTYTHVKAAMNNYTHSMYVGALGTSFTLGGKFSDNNSGRAETIYKVGAGTMTFTGRYVNWLNLNEGTVYVTSTDATVVHNGVAFNGGVLQLASGVTQDFSGLVQSSTAAVKVGVDDGASLTWATALNANNTVAEIEKYGAGTLTLTYAPAWDSTKVTVAEGSLVMPDTSTVTYGDNTIVSARDTTAGTMTLAYATTVALTVPEVDGTTVAVTYVDSNGDTQTVAVSDTANVYLVPVGTEVTVTYTGTTGTVVTSGGTITGTYHEATEVDTTGVTVASAAVWVGNAVENGDNLWSTATNWDPEGVPGQTTLVEFPAANSEYTVILTGWSPCAGMSVEGTVTVQQQADTVNWLAIQSGGITGGGTLKLNNIGVSNDSGSTVAIAPDVVILTTSDDEAKPTTFANGAFAFNGDVTVDGWMFNIGAANTFNRELAVNGRFRQVWQEGVHYQPVFAGDVVIGEGVYVENYTDVGFVLNGCTVTGLGTGGYLHTGSGSGTTVAGTGVTIAGKVIISSATTTPLEAPVLMRPDSTLTVKVPGTVTSVNPVDAAYCAVTDNESSPRVFTCSWKAEATPEIDMAVASPVTVTTSGVTFAVAADSLIEGLYYRVKAVDGEDNESAAASTEKVKYTGDNVSALNFTAPLPTDGVLYYTIEASDDE